MASIRFDSWVLASLFVCAAAGCGDTKDSSDTSGSALTDPGHYDLEILNDNWTFITPSGGTSQTAQLPAGTHLGINYVRNYSLFGLSEGPSAIEVDWTIDGGLVQTASASNDYSVSDGRIGFESGIDVPATAQKSLQVWFKFTDAQGHVGYDSLGGKNYAATVVPAATTRIHFAAPNGTSWPTPYTDKPLAHGGLFVIDYDFGRLAALGGGAYGQIEEMIVYRDATGKPIGSPVGGIIQKGSPSTAFTIPSSAADVEIWFEVGEHDQMIYDSNFGKNFDFPVE
jgi:hypothetical protein